MNCIVRVFEAGLLSGCRRLMRAKYSMTVEDGTGEKVGKVSWGQTETESTFIWNCDGLRDKRNVL